MRRVAIIASASGTGKTTLELAARLGVRLVELRRPAATPSEADRRPADV